MKNIQTKFNMKVYILLLLLIVCNNMAYTQTITYYKDETLTKEVTKEKATYLKKISMNGDSSVTTEVTNIITNEVVRSETYKGIEPWGIWKIKNENGLKELDYNFQLDYFEPVMKEDTVMHIVNIFQNDIVLHYTAPVTSKGRSCMNAVVNELYRAVLPDNIEGKVYVKLTITAEGNIQNISVNKEANILLGKETVRAIKLLSFSKPPKLNGQPITCYGIVPFYFKSN